MELKAIIREMLKAGMTEQQILDNLHELGVENAEEVLKSATEKMSEMSLQPPAQKEALKPAEKPNQQAQPPAQYAAPKPVEPAQPVQQAQPQERQGGARELFAPGSEEEKPNFSFTSVSSEGEKEVVVGAGKRAASDQPPSAGLMTPVAKTSISNADELETKLDQTIALLKALQDINQKILQSQRDVLLRLK